MQAITIKLPDATVESLDEKADEEYDGNRSKAVRILLEKGVEYDDLEAERDRLQRQLAAVNTRQDDVDELVEYVEDELSYREAGLGTRIRWFLFGKGD